MSRIPEDELERLKREVPIRRLVEADGVELKRHGKDWIGRCPFHDDKTPSLVVSPEKNLWNCLGACHVGGSTIDWVMRARKVSFRHAVELLRQELPGGEGSPASKSPASKPRVVLDVAGQDLLGEVTKFYYRTLKESPIALRYLESRGLACSEAIVHFRGQP